MKISNQIHVHEYDTEMCSPMGFSLLTSDFDVVWFFDITLHFCAGKATAAIIQGVDCSVFLFVTQVGVKHSPQRQPTPSPHNHWNSVSDCHTVKECPRRQINARKSVLKVIPSY